MPGAMWSEKAEEKGICHSSLSCLVCAEQHGAPAHPPAAFLPELGPLFASDQTAWLHATAYIQEQGVECDWDLTRPLESESQGRNQQTGTRLQCDSAPVGWVPPGKPGSTEHSSTRLCLAKAPAELCLCSQGRRELVRMCKHGLSHGGCEVPHLRGGVLLTK